MQYSTFPEISTIIMVTNPNTYICIIYMYIHTYIHMYAYIHMQYYVVIITVLCFEAHKVTTNIHTRSIEYYARGVSYCARGVSYYARGVSYCARGVLYCAITHICYDKMHNVTDDYLYVCFQSIPVYVQYTHVYSVHLRTYVRTIHPCLQCAPTYICTYVQYTHVYSLYVRTYMHIQYTHV